MRYKIKGSLILGIILLVSSCQNKEPETELKSEFGKSIYYDAFLWKQGRNDTLTKSFVYDFNQWATETDSYVQLSLSDHTSEPISSSNKTYHFLVNDKPVVNGLFSIESSKKSLDTIRLQIVFKEKINSEFYGFISIKEHNIDRVNDIDQLNSANIYKWSASQQVKMNPLQFRLICIAGVLLTLLLIYLLVLRPIMFKRFGRGVVTIQSPFYKNTPVKNRIKIVYTNKKEKQGFLNKVFKGKIVYVVHDYFNAPLILTPGIKGRIRVKTNGAYSIEPFTSNMEKGKTFKITNTSTNEEITLTYL
ncbi:hypothetical protein [Myroides pelagicus]|uniref:Uncharacterized protein n=1 Tax=Myroides pelagicus TaxID=270914 RepID=A0A7K1GK61_9FLAO|nr:hypothetical protein [Myroides pelagicus]MTH29206.1 hypothetical protein [Myroides pelagicus]